MNFDKERKPREIQILEINRKVAARFDERRIRVAAENPSIHKFVITQPELIEGEDRMRSGAYFGTIWISTFQEPNEVRRVALKDKDVLYERGDSSGPAEWTLLRWNECSDIEKAIRFTGHINEGYDKKNGPQVIKTKLAIDVMRSLLQEFRSGDMTQERLDTLRESTIRQLMDAGYGNARKTIKREMAEQIELAAGKDSIARINELVSRSRIASAWVKATRELIFAEKVRDKFPYLQGLLVTERATERLFMEYGVNIIDNILNMGARNRNMDRALRTLRRFSNGYFESGRIHANPYRGPAIIAHASLFGLDNNSYGPKKMLAAYLGEESARELISQPSILDVYNNSNWRDSLSIEKINMRLVGARDELRFALDVGDEQK